MRTDEMLSNDEIRTLLGVIEARAKREPRGRGNALERACPTLAREVLRLREGLREIQDRKTEFDETDRRDEELDAVVAIDEIADNLLAGRAWNDGGEDKE